MPVLRSTKSIQWLFLDPMNDDAMTYTINVSAYEWKHMTGAAFILEKVIPNVKLLFDLDLRPFELRLWIPRNPIAVRKATPEWVQNNIEDLDDPTTVAVKRNVLGSPINKVLSIDAQPLREPPKDHLHLFVTVKGRKQRWEHHHEEVPDTVPNLGQVTHMNYLAIPTDSGKLPLPSTAAKQVESQTTIYDGSYHFANNADTAGPPITIYHPVFQSFTDNITTARPDKELLAEVHRCMKSSTIVGAREGRLTANTQTVLTRIIGEYMAQVIDGASLDGVISKARNDCEIPLLVIEHKRSIGEGGCDPLIQASHTARRIWCRKNLRQVRDGSCCPTFIIAGGGPYLAIFGAIVTDKFIVQRLTGLEWIGIDHVFEVGRVYRVAQIFDSLRKALQQLDEFYRSLNNQPHVPLRRPNPRFFPCYTTYTDPASNSTVEFEYLEPLTLSNKSPFLVKIKHSNEKAVVKFVVRYGAEAHQALAQAGMAPRLRFCGSLDGRDDARGVPTENTKDVFGLHLGLLRMVVMDYVDGTHLEALEEDERPKDLYENVKAMVDTLHHSGFVSGDLRPPNVMVSDGKVLLVDFDWAGRHGEVRYPAYLVGGITDHCHGRDLGIIEKEHDRALLDFYFR